MHKQIYAWQHDISWALPNANKLSARDAPMVLYATLGCPALRNYFFLRRGGMDELVLNLSRFESTLLRNYHIMPTSRGIYVTICADKDHITGFPV
jgi:hypothetical protein